MKEETEAALTSVSYSYLWGTGTHTQVPLTHDYCMALYGLVEEGCD